MDKSGRLLAEDEKGKEGNEEEGKQERDSGDGVNHQDIWGDENKFSCLEFMVMIIAKFTLVCMKTLLLVL